MRFCKKEISMILDMSSSSDVDLLLNQCEHYLNQYDIMNLIKESLHKLCIHQPDNPIHFLKQYFSGEPYDQVRRKVCFFCVPYK